MTFFLRDVDLYSYEMEVEPKVDFGVYDYLSIEERRNIIILIQNAGLIVQGFPCCLWHCR